MTTPSGRLWKQERRLIERYWRLRMHKRATNASRFVMRRVLPMRERERQKALASALSQIARQAAKSRKYQFESSAVLFNLALFFLIAERDIQAVKIDALTHRDPWRRSLCARIILLTIHELDLDKAAGTKLRKALFDAGVTERARDRAKQALRKVRLAQQKAQKQFAFLRNSTIAHRDADAVLQYRAITELDEMKVLRIAAEFYDGTHLFLDVMPELLLSVGTMPGLFRQLKARPARDRSGSQHES
jgi:hypothetical protein